jgi:hypothetical protein
MGGVCVAPLAARDVTCSAGWTLTTIEYVVSVPRMVCVLYSTPLDLPQ